MNFRREPIQPRVPTLIEMELDHTRRALAAVLALRLGKETAIPRVLMDRADEIQICSRTENGAIVLWAEKKENKCRP